MPIWRALRHYVDGWGRYHGRISGLPLSECAYMDGGQPNTTHRSATVRLCECTQSSGRGSRATANEQLEHMARLADQRRDERRTSFLSSGSPSSFAHSDSPAVCNTVPSSASSLRFARAQAVGAPPHGRGAHARRQRSQWYKAFTGETLESKGNLAAQQKAFDAVARAWRSHRDRRSLGASPWDGHVTSGAEQRMNDL